MRASHDAHDAGQAGGVSGSRFLSRCRVRRAKAWKRGDVHFEIECPGKV